MRSADIINQSSEDDPLSSEDDPFERKTVGFVLPKSVATRIVNQGGIFSSHPQPNVHGRVHSTLKSTFSTFLRI